MNTPVYVSNPVEVALDDLPRILDLSYHVIELANEYDLSLMIMEDVGQLLLVFTYTSSRILEFDEFEYLDRIFDRVTVTLQNLLIEKKISIN